MKSLILGLIFGSICVLGFNIGNKFKKKEKFYYEFKNFLIYLKSEIGFFERDIVEIVDNYKTKNTDLTELLLNYKNSLQDKEFVDLNLISKEENNKLKDFFKGLGKSDCESQKEYIDKNLEIFDSLLKQAKLNNDKQGSMYKKLSILVAILVCIIII